MTKAAHVPVEIDPDEFLIAHGAPRFLKADKVMEMKRKGKTGPFLHVFIFSIQENDTTAALNFQHPSGCDRLL